mmetsp:Transcript_28527/g.90917  ORF Transcript_28527/g.90917 Transcript_28527/m.90917 type:complete len:131 (-) Transcript_28527:98-490(-)
MSLRSSPSWRPIQCRAAMTSWQCSRSRRGSSPRRAARCRWTSSPSTSHKRYIFSNARALSTATRGRGVIISSGARSPMELRGPYDVLNLGTLFGLTSKAAKDAITSSCRAVLEHGAARRTYKGIVSMDMG